MTIFYLIEIPSPGADSVTGITKDEELNLFAFSDSEAAADCVGVIQSTAVFSLIRTASIALSGNK